MRLPGRFNNGIYRQTLRRKFRKNSVEVFLRNVAPDQQRLFSQNSFMGFKQFFGGRPSLINVQLHRALQSYVLFTFSKPLYLLSKQKPERLLFSQNDVRQNNPFLCSIILPYIILQLFYARLAPDTCSSGIKVSFSGRSSATAAQLAMQISAIRALASTVLDAQCGVRIIFSKDWKLSPIGS